MDDELFELCKEVYELTEWYDTGFVWKDGIRQPLYEMRVGDDCYPYYTSDYLLEQVKEATGTILLVPQSDGDWLLFTSNGATDTEKKYIRGDTPLKALLKLVLALKKAGEL